CACSRQVSVGAFANKIPLKLGKSTHQVKSQFAARRCGTDVLGETHKIHVPLFEEVEGLDKIFEGATEPIQLPHHQYISWPNISKRFVQPLPLKFYSCLISRKSFSHPASWRISTCNASFCSCLDTRI